jgi:phage gpG-like protein
MMTMTVSIPDLAKLGKAIQPTPSDYIDLVTATAKIIRDRTRRGIDVDGKTFTAYSEAYEEIKKQPKRNVDLVDLTLHNRLLSSMTPKPMVNGAMLYFADSERRKIAYFHQAGGRVPQREFFGLSEGEAKQLLTRLETKLRERMK